VGSFSWINGTLENVKVFFTYHFLQHIEIQTLFMQPSLAFSSYESKCLGCFSDSITQTVTHRSGNIMFPQEWQIMAYWNIDKGKRASGKFNIKWRCKPSLTLRTVIRLLPEKSWRKYCWLSVQQLTVPKPSMVTILFYLYNCFFNGSQCFLKSKWFLQATWSNWAKLSQTLIPLSTVYEDFFVQI